MLSELIYNILCLHTHHAKRSHMPQIRWKCVTLTPVAVRSEEAATFTRNCAESKIWKSNFAIVLTPLASLPRWTVKMFPVPLYEQLPHGRRRRRSFVVMPLRKIILELSREILCTSRIHLTNIIVIESALVWMELKIIGSRSRRKSTLSSWESVCESSVSMQTMLINGCAISVFGVSLLLPDGCESFGLHV